MKLTVFFLALTVLSAQVKQETKDEISSRVFNSKNFETAMAEECYPRDIFAYLRNNKYDLHGWRLEFKPQIVFSGSLDWATYIVTARKGKLERYFWVLEKSGVDQENQQSVDETRVKQLDSPDENPERNKWWEKGFWDKAHRTLWVPFSSDRTLGVCDWGGISMSPMTRATCFKVDDK